MMSRLRWAGIALFALLVAVPPSAAQESASTAAADTTTKAPAPPAGSIAGHSGIGGAIGASQFMAADDYSKGAQPRFDFSASLRYVLAPGWRMQVSPGFTWAAYSKEEPPPSIDPRFPSDVTKEGYITQVTPISVQLQKTWGTGRMLWHLGAGPGLYRVVVQNQRRTLQDGVTFARHRGVYLGGTVQLGFERFFRSIPATSVEFSAANHFVLATRDDQFPSGWNSSLDVVSLRMGMNYYFDVGILDREARKLPPSATGARKK